MNAASESKRAGEKPKKDGRLWAYVPAVWLAVFLVGLGVTASIAMDDPGFALERDYYQKAVAWDAAQHQQAENERLGYRVTAADVLRRRSDGGVLVELTVVDGSGLPLTGAAVTAEAFANSRAGAIQSLAFRETTPGVYGAELKDARRGLWELRVTVQRRTERFTAIVRRDVVAEGAS